jgi:xanthine dehydrogenase YagR molybdenum-binding subunit
MSGHEFKDLVGQPLDRVDGPLKVSGRATYAADWRGDKPHLIGFIVESPVARGRIVSIDTKEAEACEGVKAIVTHENAPSQIPFGERADGGRFAQSHAMMRSDEVRHVGYPVALVVAATLEQARHAASLVRVEIETEDGIFNPETHEDKAIAPDGLDGSDEVDTEDGDFVAEFAKAAHKVEGEFHTPSQHAAAMEPHATVAEWDGDRLTVHMAIQILGDGRKAFANTFGIDPEDVRIVSPYVGGGFGSKLGVHNEAILAAQGAKLTGQPVRIAQHRRNVFSNGPHRARHRQRLKLGADADGKILAIHHDSLSIMARDYPFAEAAASPTRASYAAKAMRTKHRVVEGDVPKVDSMRAPGEAIGTLTFESMIDELAHECGVDPVEFRLRNEPETDPHSGKPFSTRKMRRCLQEGAEKFGWKGPVSRREGDWLIGHGMAAAIRPNLMQEAEAEIELSADGHLTVRLDMTDIGTGTYTILTQIAAETLGIAPDKVTVKLGDTDFPETCGSGGSFGAGSTGTAVFAAAKVLKDDLLERAAKADSDWKGANSKNLRIEGAKIVLGSRSLPISELANESGGLSAKGAAKPGKEHKTMAQYSYGAQFAEVAVDAVTGEIRLRRLTGVFDAGRILNEKTARSQLMGGMIFGIGAALMEESLMDERYGAFMNRDFAEYHVAVNRDVPRLDVHMVEGFDENSNPLGSKGIGELGICGAGPAIANAVFAATGHRVRKFPIHMEDLLGHLPPLAG